MNDETAVDVRGLRVVRGATVVLDGLSLTVPAGHVVGLLGPSGAGKTTLMRAIVGVQRVAGGSVSVLGLPAGARELRGRVGYVSQRPSVYADLTVVENLRHAAGLLGVGRDEVERVLADVDLVRHRGTLVSRLSGGEAARVSLGVGLLGSPPLLVLDEPTVGLDPVLRRDLWALFRTLRDRGTTLLVSSHVMDEAERCDRVLLVRDGALLADDTVPGLLAATGADGVEGAFLALVEGRGR